MRPSSHNHGNLGGESYYFYQICALHDYFSSDKNYKTNITPMDIEDAYDIVKGVPVYKYQTADSDFYDFSIGAMVQDMPIELVNVSSDNAKSYSGMSVVWTLWSAVQKLQKRVEELEAMAS